MKKQLKLSGLDCAACAAELEREIAAIDGVTSVSVAFVTQQLTIEYENESALEKAVYTANHFEEVKVLDNERTGAGLRRMLKTNRTRIRKSTANNG